MTRLLNASAIRKAALHERLPLGINLHVASLDPRRSPVTRAMYRVAARYVLGRVDSADYDIIARLQVLEGASQTVPLGPGAGRWWKKGRRGLADAAEFYRGTDIDPSWLSTSNTGFISKIMAMVTKSYYQWSNRSDGPSGVEDLMQTYLMGLTKSGEGQYTGGPVLFQFGYKTGLPKTIPSGEVSPRMIAGAAGKYFVKKVRNEFTKGDTSRGNNETLSGESVFEHVQETLFSGDQASREELFLTLVRGNDPMGDLIRNKLREEWADASETVRGSLDEWLNEVAAGRRPNQSAIAARWGIAGGTMQRNLKEYMDWAIARLRRDGKLQDAISSYIDRMQGRVRLGKAARRVTRLRRFHATRS